MFRPPRIQRWTLLHASHTPCTERDGRRIPPAHPAVFRLPPILPLLLSLVSCAGCTQQDAFFCPNDGCADRLIDEIRASTSTTHVAIAYFSHYDIADALIEAHARGIDVKVLVEANTDGINDDVVKRLRSAGVPLLYDSNPNLMHHKFTVVDGQTVLTGSFNYTYFADTENNENLVVLTSPRMAGAFEDEFMTLWSSGVE